jgi:hypothetical protein
VVRAVQGRRHVEIVDNFHNFTVFSQYCSISNGDSNKYVSTVKLKLFKFYFQRNYYPDIESFEYKINPAYVNLTSELRKDRDNMTVHNLNVEFLKDLTRKVLVGNYSYLLVYHFVLRYFIPDECVNRIHSENHSEIGQVGSMRSFRQRKSNSESFGPNSYVID